MSESQPDEPPVDYVWVGTETDLSRFDEIKSTLQECKESRIILVVEHNEGEAFLQSWMSLVGHLRLRRRQLAFYDLKQRRHTLESISGKFRNGDKWVLFTTKNITVLREFPDAERVIFSRPCQSLDEMERFILPWTAQTEHFTTIMTFFNLDSEEEVRRAEVLRVTFKDLDALEAASLASSTDDTNLIEVY